MLSFFLVLKSKHRIWPKLTPKFKRYLVNRIEIEVENMKHISRTYLTKVLIQREIYMKISAK
jgi:hypothetical protein